MLALGNLRAIEKGTRWFEYDLNRYASIACRASGMRKSDNRVRLYQHEYSRFRSVVQR